MSETPSLTENGFFRTAFRAGLLGALGLLLGFCAKVGFEAGAEVISHLRSVAASA